MAVPFTTPRYLADNPAHMPSPAAAATTFVAAGTKHKHAHNILEELDEQALSWFHFKTIIVAGMGFFTDAYDLFCIGLLTKLIGRIYFSLAPPLNPQWTPAFPVSPTNLQYVNCKTTAGLKCPGPGVLPINQNAAVTSVALCGTLCGQLVWGIAGDYYGRKAVYGYTLITMIVGAVGQSMSFGFTTKAIIGTLCFWRFVLGYGVGGDYPLSATIMSEYASRKQRGGLVGAVFAMQGVGYLVAATTVITVVGIAQAYYPSYGFVPTDPLGSLQPIDDFIWRGVLCFGALPAALTMYWRMLMPETARYTALVEGNAKRTAADMGLVLKTHFEEDEAPIIPVGEAEALWAYLKVQPKGMFWSNWIMLVGCCSCWFLLDIAFYSQGLFQKDVFTAVGWLPKANTMSAAEETFLIARAQALIALGSTIPGYWATVFTVDYMGRWWIQTGGFFFMTMWMAILAAQYNDLIVNNVNAFIVYYALTFFFANWGPNSTTFIVPAELFAARFRSTCHGIAAASGKAGAIIGAFGFLYATQPGVGELDPYGNPNLPATGYPNGIGLQRTLGILAATNFVGMVCTVFVPETMNRSLEDMSGEHFEILRNEDLTVQVTDKRYMTPKHHTALSDVENVIDGRTYFSSDAEHQHAS